MEVANTDRYGNVCNVCQDRQDVTVDKINIQEIHEVHTQLTCFLCLCLSLYVTPSYNLITCYSVIHCYPIFIHLMTKHGADCTAMMGFYE
jgi:hypothetical protein